MASFEAYRAEYEANWSSLQIRPEKQAAAEKAARLVLAGKAKYQAVEARTGVPWDFIGLCHYRESSCDFDTYLGNGQSLHRKTTEVPANRGPFSSFEEGAVDALTIQGFLHAIDWSIARRSYRWEGFNGYGYHDPYVRGTKAKLGHPVPSPYLYGGSTVYESGKYTRDHYFDPGFIDPQLGTLVIFKALLALDPTIRVDGAAAANEPHEEAIAHGVSWAQQSLNALGADPKLAEDGKLGPKSMAMVKRFQGENGLPESGLLDAATIAALENHVAAQTSHVAAAAAPQTAPSTPPRRLLGQDVTDALRRIFG